MREFKIHAAFCPFDVKVIEYENLDDPRVTSHLEFQQSCVTCCPIQENRSPKQITGNGLVGTHNRVAIGFLIREKQALAALREILLLF